MYTIFVYTMHVKSLSQSLANRGEKSPTRILVVPSMTQPTKGRFLNHLPYTTQSFSGWWFQPVWKICSSNWIISPSRGENKKWLKPPTSFSLIWREKPACYDQLWQEKCQVHNTCLHCFLPCVGWYNIKALYYTQIWGVAIDIYFYHLVFSSNCWHFGPVLNQNGIKSNFFYTWTTWALLQCEHKHIVQKTRDTSEVLINLNKPQQKPAVLIFLTTKK